MGGIGTSIRVEKIAGEPSCDPRTLHEELFEKLHDRMYQELRRPQNHYTLGEYISDERYSGYERETWSYNDHTGELDYSFFDAAGCCNLSMEAALHWFELAFAMARRELDSHAERRGWKITGPDWTVSGLVRYGTRYPLIYIGSEFYSVCRTRGRPLEDGDIFGNDGSNPPRIADLDDSKRAKVERIAITGRCDCEMCSRGRKSLKPKIKRGERKPLDEKKTYGNVPRAWELFRSDDQCAELVAATAGVIRDFSDDEWLASPFGPPELLVLGDWLQSHGAQVATTDLTRMVVTYSQLRDE